MIFYSGLLTISDRPWSFPTQFGSRELCLERGTIRSVARREHLQKPVLTFYKTIMFSQASPLEKSFKRWQQDVPELEDHLIEELKSSCRSPMISARDQLIQMKWLHRVYFTPVRLVQMRRLSSDICSRCGQSRGILIHMVGNAQYFGLRSTISSILSWVSREYVPLGIAFWG